MVGILWRICSGDLGVAESTCLNSQVRKVARNEGKFWPLEGGVRFSVALRCTWLVERLSSWVVGFRHAVDFSCPVVMGH
jgi:hypothetical protein